MSKYLIETFYTCTFKIVHKLDELNEKNLSELENRNDGDFELIDVRLNNRKTKTVNENISEKNNVFCFMKCIMHVLFHHWTYLPLRGNFCTICVQ